MLATIMTFPVGVPSSRTALIDRSERLAERDTVVGPRGLLMGSG